MSRVCARAQGPLNRRHGKRSLKERATVSAHGEQHSVWFCPQRRNCTASAAALHIMMTYTVLLRVALGACTLLLAVAKVVLTPVFCHALAVDN